MLNQKKRFFCSHCHIKRVPFFLLLGWLAVYSDITAQRSFWVETNGLSTRRALSLAINGRGTLFAGTQSHGAFRLESKYGIWRLIGLENYSVKALTINDSGNIFAGTENGGVFRYFESDSSFWMACNGLTNLKVLALAVSYEGHIWIGTDGSGVFQLQTSCELDKQIDNLPTTMTVKSLAFKGREHIFVGTESFGIFSSSDSGRNWIPRAAIPDAFDVSAFTIQPVTGHIFAGTKNGVLRSQDNGDTWEKILSIDKRDRRVHALAIDSLGNLFAGTDSGVVRFQNQGNSWRQLTTGITNSQIWALAVDDSGYIFAGTDSGVFRSRDTMLPQLDTTITSSPSAQRSQEFTIRAKLKDDVGVDSVRLFYHRAGEMGFESLRMINSSQEGNEFDGTIPGNFVTPRGVEYYIRAWDLFENTNRFPADGIVSIQVKVDSLLKTIVRYGSEQNDYRLMSVPLDLIDNSPASILSNLGVYDGTKWRLYELREDQQYYQYPKISPVKPGKAFWLIVKEPGKTIRIGAGTTLRTDTIYSIPLHPRWNFVGNPFNFSIPLNKIRMQHDSLSLDIRTYDGLWDTSIVSLQPFEGYAVFANSPDTLLINPNLADSNTKDQGPKEILWSIRIFAQCQNARDIDNFIAVIPTSSDSCDEFDQPEPPVIGEYASVYFPHRDWNSLAKTFCIDARPEPTEGEIWEFEVKTNIRDKVNLTFEEIESVPEAFEVWLVDEAVSIAQNLRENKSYSVAGRGPEHPKSLKLVVGKSDFIAKKLTDIQLIPTSYELSQNFPNPFNPATTIRYGLPKAERVTLKIYNLLGEEVAILMNDEPRVAGYHAAIWDGRNKAGSVVASGVYVYRIRAGGFTMTKKMAMVK